MGHLKPFMTRTLIATFAAFCLGALAAGAHGVRIFAAQDGNMIVGKVYFAGGGVAEDVEVDVIGKDGLKVATVKTNSKGEFLFSPKSKDAEYKFAVDTGDGHAAKASVSLGVSAPAVKRDPMPSSAALQAKEKELVQQQVQEAAASAQSALDAKALEEIVSRAVSTQLLPLQERLEHYESTTRFKDVLAGIGYIFGIAGAAAFLYSRRSRKTEGAEAPK